MMAEAPASPAMRMVEAPAAWHASDVRQRPAIVHALDDAEVRELDAALRHALLDRADAAWIGNGPFPLPRLGRGLQVLRHELAQGSGVGLIRGIPTGTYDEREAEVLLCGIASHFGRPMPQNGEGEMLNHVRDTADPAPTGLPARGYRTGAALPFHSDSCDYVGLLCIRAALAGGLSAVASAYAVHNAMLDSCPDLLRALYEPFHIDRHGENAPGAPRYYSTPVFMWHQGRLFCRFNPGYTYSAQRYPEAPRLTERQMAAMEVFGRLCASDRFRLDMEFQPGDLQLLNNNTIVHARSAYQDHPDASRKRHLLRVWLFTSAVDDLPVPMRERYRDMEGWLVRAHLPSDVAPSAIAKRAGGRDAGFE